MDGKAISALECASAIPFEFGRQAKAISCRVFLALRQRNVDLTYWELCSLTGAFVGKSRFTVDRILSQAVATGDVGDLVPRPGPPRSTSQSLFDEVLHIVRRYLEMPKDISFRFVYQQLQGLHEHVPAYAALVDQMHSWGFCFGTPHEEPAALRERWLLERVREHAKHKVAQRSPDGLPTMPEVYIDESSCHTHYHRHATVFHPALAPSVHRLPQEGQMVLIAGAVVARAVGGKLVVEWVPNTFRCWLHRQSSTASASVVAGRSKRTLDGDDFSPDYHGSVNAQTFEPWFENVCVIAKEQYGNCRVYLDNARYHKRHLDHPPTTASRKQDMIQWITSHSLPHPSHPTKATLMEIIRQHRDEFRRYAIVEMAKTFGHVVENLPQYYPQLNMIETVWAVLKTHVASDTATSGIRLRDPLLKLHLTACPNTAMEGAYATMQAHEALLLSDVQVRLELAGLGVTVPF